MSEPANNTPTPIPSPASNTKLICILEYLPLICLVGLFVEKDNEDVKFHTNQGLSLFALEVIISIVGGILSLLRGIPVLGFLIGLVFSLLGLVCLAYMILGIINVINGKREQLPFIGNLVVFVK